MDLFLRHGANLYDASAVIFELDYRGLFRDRFCGKATLIPAATGNADYVQIALPVYIAMSFMPHRLCHPHRRWPGRVEKVFAVVSGQSGPG